MDSNKITVTTENNQQLEVEVLDIFNVEGYKGKDYILYTLEEKLDETTERAYVSILSQQNNNFSLTEIMNQKEWEAVQKAIEENIAEDE